MTTGSLVPEQDDVVDPSTWVWDVTLPDVGVVHIRPIRPSDADLLIEMHARLSPETIYLRFFSAHPRLSESELHRFTHVDLDGRVALVALVAGRLVGVARFDRSKDAQDRAELAIVVEDKLQHHGIGVALLQRLAIAARDRGIRTFTAEVLPSNRTVLELFRQANLRHTETFSDVVNLEIPLGVPAVADAPPAP